MSSGGEPDYVPTNDENPDGKLMQFEFVHAVVRLAKAKYAKAAPDLEGAPLAWALEVLVCDCIGPKLGLEPEDEITALMRDRRLRAVLAKHSDVLRKVFLTYSAVDESDWAVGAVRPTSRGGASKHSASAGTVDYHALLMNLNELLTLLKEAGLLDEKCSARAVTTFFVKVNLDDELYMQSGVTCDHTQLEYPEFTEVLVRVCEEKAQFDQVSAPLTETLDSWLGLYCIPAFRRLLEARSNGNGKVEK